MSAQPVNPNLPPDHVTVFIDGNELAAPKGSMIIHAADKAGIPIPRFCYHDKLPIAANCRMCLVEAEMGGRMSPKPLPACATPVADGMKVFTRSEKALKSQRNVMEFLLINHPLDCPICDQGGECELQDLSLGYGRSVSRFVERKRAVADEDLGPLVASEMTRCIQCTRCVRFTADIAGTYELGGMQRGENLQIGTYDGKPLTTELSGNVIDVCPVGALTNKVFRFKARPWELTAKPSLGYHDALGSNLFLHARRGEVLRTVPRDNEAVNECWLSDRDRYAHEGLYAADRAGVPLLHHRVRRATVRGAKVHVVNPVDFDFTFAIASKKIVPPSQLATALAQVELGDAANVAVIVGAVAENSVHASAIRQAAADFASAKNARLCRIPQGANALGLSQHGVLPTSRDAQSMRRDARSAYVIYGIEPGLDFADQHAALKALGGAQVVAFSQFACQSTRRVADVILPIGALPEIEATLSNLEGVQQSTAAAGKLPGDARPGWRVLRALATDLSLPGFEFTDLAGLRAGIAAKVVQAAQGKPVEQGGNGLEVAVSQAIYRVDAVVRRAQALQEHPLTVGARVVLNTADATAAGLAEGAMAKLGNGLGTATLQVVVDDRVAPGSAWIESGYGATAPLAASARVEVVRA